MATYRGICEPRILLSCRNADSISFRICSAFTRKGSLARPKHGIDSSIRITIRGDMFHELGKTGLLLHSLYL